MNFARFNHILIPSTKAERDRFRNRRTSRFVFSLFSWVFLLSPEGQGAFVLWLISGAISLNVGTTQFYFLWSALTGLIFASLILARWYPLKGIQIDVDVPPRISVGETMTFAVRLRNEGAETHKCLRLHRPFLPWDGTWQNPIEGCAELRPDETTRLVAVATFRSRGAHHLDPFQASKTVPSGLAHGPAIQSAGVRFLVVPRIAKVTGFSMPLSHRYQPGGIALASMTGESRELIGVRPYRPGDPIRDLHAPTWARVGVPVVREYRQEYFTRVGVVVDTDLSKRSDELFESALSFTAGLVAHLSRGEALIDLLLIGDSAHRLMLGRQLGFLDQALDLLACAEPGPSWSSEHLQRQLQPHLQRLSSLVLVTMDWDHPRRGFGNWITERGVGFRAVHVVSHSEDTDSVEPACTVLSAVDIEGPSELHL